MTHLANKNCRLVDDDEQPMKGNDLTHYQAQLHNDWEVVDENHMRRKFMFPSYQEAIEFTNKVAEIADSEEHHPEILLSYGEVGVAVKTHEIDGLHENDFIMAAKIDREHRRFQKSN